MTYYAIHNSDCLSPDTGMITLSDLSVDVSIFDPPYSAHVHRVLDAGRSRTYTDGNTKRNKLVGFEALDFETMCQMADQIARVTRRWILVFSDLESSPLWEHAFNMVGIERIRIGLWIKVNGAPQFTGDRPAVPGEAVNIFHRPGRKQWNGGGKHALWSYPTVISRGAGEIRCHPTQKPLELMSALVRDFSNRGESILDCTMGSGTTGIAALQLGRRFIGYEQMEEHYQTARRRLESAVEQPGLFDRLSASQEKLF